MLKSNRNGHADFALKRAVHPLVSPVLGKTNALNFEGGGIASASVAEFLQNTGLWDEDLSYLESEVKNVLINSCDIIRQHTVMLKSNRNSFALINLGFTALTKKLASARRQAIGS